MVQRAERYLSALSPAETQRFFFAVIQSESSLDSPLNELFEEEKWKENRKK